MASVILGVDLITETASLGPKGVYAYSREYLVEASGEDATVLQVGAVLPAWGSAHPSDPYALAKTVSATQRRGELCYWDCRVDWDTAPDDNQYSRQIYPTLRPYVYKWGARHRTKYFQQDRRSDLAGGPRDVVNAAKQLLGGGLELPVANPTLTITGIKAVDPGSDELDLAPGQRDEQKISDYVDKVNDATFRYVWPAGWARCTEYALSSIHEFGTYFWEFSVTIEFQEGGWNPVKLLNAGTVVLGKYDPGTHTYGPPKPAKYADGKIPGGPVPLSADGTRVLRQDEAPNYLEFTGYEYADFLYLITGEPPEEE